MTQRLIGIVVAMESELKPILEDVAPYKIYNYLDRIFYVSKKAIAVQSSVGEISSASATESLVAYAAAHNISISKILNVGICGSLKMDKYSIGDILIVESVCHYDFDLSPHDPVKPGEYPNMTDAYFDLDVSSQEKLINEFGAAKLVRCASGDKFIANKVDQDRLVKEFNADICDMELAGIVITAKLHHIPVAAIKSVSDIAGADNQQKNYCQGKQNAISNYRNAVKLIINQEV